MIKSLTKYLEKRMKEISKQDLEAGRKQLKKTGIRFEQDYD